ncbi:MAG: glycosyltransferase family 4 protein [candidate division WOR-3 bacterium]
MRILILSPYLPLPEQGGGGTTYYYYIRHLARQHEVNLLCLCRGRETSPSSELTTACRSIETHYLGRLGPYVNSCWALLGNRPFRLAYYHSRPFQDAVTRYLAHHEVDVIIASHERMGQFVPATRACRVIDLHDVVSDRHLMLAENTPNPLLRIGHRLEARRLHDYQVKCLKEYDSVWVSTPSEAQKLRPFDSEGRVCVMPRGIDLADFTFGLIPCPTRDLIFTGNLSYAPNVDGAVFYLTKIRPLIRSRLPNVRTLFVGNHPDKRIIALAQGQPDIVVTGRVPHMAEYLRRAYVFVAPLRIGTGARMKLLEAMAIGIPCVSTSVGCSGLGLEAGEHLLVADDPAAFADSVCRLFRDESLHARLSHKARQFVEANYGMSEVADRLDATLRQLVTSRR